MSKEKQREREREKERETKKQTLNQREQTDVCEWEGGEGMG